jgi:hypothetical protein
MIPFVLSRTVSSVLVTDVRYKGNYAMLLAQIWEARNKAKGGKKEIEVIGSLIHCWPCLPASPKKVINETAVCLEFTKRLQKPHAIALGYSSMLIFGK